MNSSLRRKYINLRNNLSAGLIEKAGQDFLAVFNSSFLKNFSFFMSYLSIRNEAPVNLIGESILSEGKFLCLPVTKDDNNIEPYRILDFNNLKEGKYNIPEPLKDIPVNPEDIEIVLVPGVAFDRAGGRIGYGKGCYDRFLKDSKALKIGVCYTFQIRENILDLKKHDIPMDYLMTEEKLIKVDEVY